MTLIFDLLTRRLLFPGGTFCAILVFERRFVIETRRVQSDVTELNRHSLALVFNELGLTNGRGHWLTRTCAWSRSH